MKRFFCLIAVSLTAVLSCNQYDEDINDINNRLDKIENTHVASLQKQIDAIKVSLPQLEKTDTELKGYIEALQASYDKIAALKEELLKECSDAMAATIATLQAKDEDLDKKIDELKKYVDSISQNHGSVDWINATFATLEHHGALVSDIAVIKAQIESVTKSISDLESRITEKISADIAEAIKTVKQEVTTAYTEAMESAIAGSEQTMKQWVNEQFDGYYNIAEVEARLSALQSACAEGDEALQAQIDKLSEEIESAREDITAAYKKAIEDAISTSEGMISSLIAAEVVAAKTELSKSISDINETIQGIEARLASAESKIATIEGQIVNINGSISSLQALYDSLAETVAGLEESDAVTADELKTLKDKALELEERMEELNSFVETELSNSEDWADATFATLDQMSATLSSIEEIRALVDSLSDEYSAELDDAIADAVSSVKDWVSQELDQYCTIARMEGQFSLLQSQIEAGDESVREEVEALSKKIDGLKYEYQVMCEQIVETAIKDNNGIIDAKIAAMTEELRALVNDSVNEINQKISDIETRLGKVEASIATIESQIAYILNSLPELKDADAELKEYIDKLEYFVDDLRVSMDEVNTEIDEVISTISEEDKKIVEELRARYDALMTLIESEILRLETAVDQLEAGESQLQIRIEILQGYVDEELTSQKEWAEATFATMDHFSYLSSEIGSIKTMIESINAGIDQLEARINTKIANDIANAISVLEADVQDDINVVMQQCYGEIEYATREITKAYTTEIQSAMVSVEYAIKSWVNSELDGYYTIAEVDALLKAMESDFDSELAAQRSYFVDLINNLSTEVKSSIERNTYYVNELQTKISTLEPTVAEHAEAIAANSTKVAENADAILEHSAQISYCMDEIGLIKSSISQLSAKIDYLENSLNNQVDQSEIEALRTEMSSLQAQLETKINQVEGLAYSNESLINSNTASISSIRSAVESLQYVAESTVPQNVEKIARNAEDIAANAQLIAKNTTAISNNAAAIAQNTSDIVQLRQDLDNAKSELTAAYQAAIQDAIAALENGSSSDFADQIAAANSRIDNLASEVNAAIDAIEARVDAIELEMDSIQQQMNTVLQEIADLKEDVQNLLNRIQSVTYIPKYADGKATVLKNLGVDEGVAEFDFQISPKDAVTDLAANWESVLSMKAVNTITRSVTFIDMPILSFEADASTGVISITASGENLGDPFYYDEIGSSAALYISDGNNVVTSDYIPLYADVPAYYTLKYTTTDGNVLTPNADVSSDVTMLTNTYTSDGGVMVFDGILYSISASAFAGCTTLESIVLPASVSDIGSFDGCSALVNIEIPDGVTKVGSFKGCSALVNIEIPDGVTKVGSFYGCSSLLELIIPDSVTEFDSVFGCTSLTKLVIGSGVEDLPTGGSFNGATGELVINCDIPGTGSYNVGAFKGSQFTKVTVNGSKIGNYAFSGCTTITELILTDNVRTIGDLAFNGCTGLSKTVIGSGITSTGTDCYGAFDSCTGELVMNSNIPDAPATGTSYRGLFGMSSFSKITIGDRVTYVGRYAFQYSRCRNYYFEAINPPVLFSTSVFTGVSNQVIYVPESAVSTYQNANVWSTYSDKIVGYDFSQNQ